MTVRTEVLRYLKEKRADMSTDPLDHSKVKKHEYTKLANMASRYLSAPAGSAASERLFSTGKNVLGTTRLSLTPTNMEANLFLKYNIRALGYKTDFPSVEETWESPNSKILPEVRIESSIDETFGESTDIVIDLPDSVYDERETSS